MLSRKSYEIPRNARRPVRSFTLGEFRRIPPNPATHRAPRAPPFQSRIVSRVSCICVRAVQRCFGPSIDHRLAITGFTLHVEFRRDAAVCRVQRWCQSRSVRSGVRARFLVRPVYDRSLFAAGFRRRKTCRSRSSHVRGSYTATPFSTAR